MLVKPFSPSFQSASISQPPAFKGAISDGLEDDAWKRYKEEEQNNRVHDAYDIRRPGGVSGGIANEQYEKEVEKREEMWRKKRKY